MALVTTFFTPYLMKVAPLVTSGMSKFAPNGLKTLFSYYTLWMSRLRQEAVGRGPLSIATRNILRSIFVDISIIAFIAIVLQIAYSYTLEQFNFYELYLAASSIVATIALPFPFVMMLLRNLGCLTDLASELLLKTSPSNRS